MSQRHDSLARAPGGDADTLVYGGHLGVGEARFEIREVELYSLPVRVDDGDERVVMKSARRQGQY